MERYRGGRKRRESKPLYRALLILLLIIGGFLSLILSSERVFAADTFTINDSTQNGIQGTTMVNRFVPFLNNECSGGNCTSYGAEALTAWMNDNFFSSGFKFVPTFGTTPSHAYNAVQMNPIFGVGQGLPSSWLNALKGNTGDFTGDDAASQPLTAPDYTGRTEWIDQIVIKYTESGSFAQNFRSQLTFGNSVNLTNGDITRSGQCQTNPTTCMTLVDQRLEQGDQDMEGLSASGGPYGANDIRQAFQQAFGATSGPNTTTNPAINPGTATKMGQNIEENVEGYFYSCLNCSANNEHAFSVPDKLVFQSWPTVVPTITSIIHADAASQTTWSP